jgi:hypothetical protein
VYLLKRHNIRINQRCKMATSVKFWARSKSYNHIHTAVLRGIECGKDGLVMFELKLN